MQGRWKRFQPRVDTKSKIGALLVSRFLRVIHFSDKFSRSSLQEMSWKLAGATNLYLQRNLILSRVADLLLRSYISKTCFSF